MPFAGEQCLWLPGFHGERLGNFADGNDRFRAIVQSRQHGGRGAQHVKDDARRLAELALRQHGKLSRRQHHIYVNRHDGMVTQR